MSGKRKISVCPKNEAYSADELDFIIESVKRSNADSRENLLKSVMMIKSLISKSEKKAAVFFMPENMASFFPPFCIQSGIEIDMQTVEKLIGAAADFSADKDFSSFMVKKLCVLKDFLSGGNKVSPFPVSMDSFEEMEVCFKDPS